MTTDDIRKARGHVMVDGKWVEVPIECMRMHPTSGDKYITVICIEKFREFIRNLRKSNQPKEPQS
jgi:hypothetical protein